MKKSISTSDVSERNRTVALVSKLAIIGIVVAALVAPATAAGGNGSRRAHPHYRQTVRACLQVQPIVPPGKNATVCGLTVWVHDSASGAVIPVPMGKWRTEVPPYGP